MDKVVTQSENVIWQDRILLLCIGLFQALLLWLGIGEAFLKIADLQSQSENIFTFPTAVLLLAPTFLFLNWDFWRSPSRRLLIFMTLGLAALLFVFDAYRWWAGIGVYQDIWEDVLPLFPAIWLLVPFARQRLAWEAVSADKRPGAGDNSPAGWLAMCLPDGESYVRELLRVAILAFTTVIVCSMCAGLLGAMAFVLEGFGSVDFGSAEFGDSGIYSITDVINMDFVFWLFCVTFTALFLSFLTRYSGFYTIVSYIHRFFAWFAGPLSILSVLVLLLILIAMLPSFYVDISGWNSIFAIGIFLLIFIVFALTLKSHGPMSRPVWAVLVKVGVFVCPLFALYSIFGLIGGIDTNEYIYKSDIVTLSFLCWFVLCTFALATGAVLRKLTVWVQSYIGLACLGVSLIIMLLLSPVLSPSRISAASYADYLATVDLEHDSRKYSYASLYNNYQKYGRNQLERLAATQGNGEREQRVRDTAAWVLICEGDIYNCGSDPDHASSVQAYLRKIPVFPRGKELPSEALELLSSYVYSSLSEDAGCFAFFIQDFSRDGVDDILFMSPSEGRWYLFQRKRSQDQSAATGEYREGVDDYLEEQDLGLEAPSYRDLENEVQVNNNTVWWEMSKTGFYATDLDYYSPDGKKQRCREFKEAVEAGNFRLVEPKPEYMNFKIGNIEIDIAN